MTLIWSNSMRHIRISSLHPTLTLTQTTLTPTALTLPTTPNPPTLTPPTPTTTQPAATRLVRQGMCGKS